MTWDRYYEALNGAKDKAQNTGFRVNNNQIVTYTQNKLGLSAYYDKRIVARRWNSHKAFVLAHFITELGGSSVSSGTT